RCPVCAWRRSGTVCLLQPSAGPYRPVGAHYRHTGRPRGGASLPWASLLCAAGRGLVQGASMVHATKWKLALVASILALASSDRRRRPSESRTFSSSLTDDVGWGDLGSYGGGAMRGAPAWPKDDPALMAMWNKVNLGQWEQKRQARQDSRLRLQGHADRRHGRAAGRRRVDQGAR